MKKLLLNVSLFAALLVGNTATAQNSTSIKVFDNAVYYGMYDGLVSTPKPEGAVRNSNSSYGKKITDEQIAQIGNRLTINVVAEALCDDYDRIGNFNLAFVPKGATSYDYKTVKRIELGRFITPFMNNITRTATTVPYTFQLDNIAKLLHDKNLSAEYDFWIELEIYGHQGAESADQGGAQWDFRASGLCRGRNDVYKGSLELVTFNDPTIVQGDDEYFEMLSYKFELKNYKQATDVDGTDVVGKTVRSIEFTVDKAVENAKFYLITSNHGSNSGGEEYIRRDHFVYLDGVQKLKYKPGETTCEPYRVYNTMPNGIYTQNVRTPAQWQSFSNWCPGAKIPNRVVELGNLSAGKHTFKIEVPDATFAGGQGYFPTSAYVQAYSQTLGTDKFAVKGFSISPNPTTSVATINADGLAVKNVSVVNTLGQVVLTGASQNVDLSSLQSGVYMVKVLFDNNQTATQKVIKK